MMGLMGISTPVQENNMEICPCGGCGIIETSWDHLGPSSEGRVFVSSCDQCGIYTDLEVAVQLADRLKCDIHMIYSADAPRVCALKTSVASVVLMLETLNKNPLW